MPQRDYELEHETDRSDELAVAIANLTRNVRDLRLNCDLLAVQAAMVRASASGRW